MMIVLAIIYFAGARVTLACVQRDQMGTDLPSPRGAFATAFLWPIVLLIWLGTFVLFYPEDPYEDEDSQ